MHSKELNERSPLRVLENSIHGGLGRGNIGVVVARAGVGKTAFLVGIALDDLMRGRKVLHVALDASVEKIRSYYDEIFMDLARSANLEDVDRERIEIERNRNIHTYLGNTFSVARLKEAITFLRNHVHFNPAMIVLEGYDFEKGAPEDLRDIGEIARSLGAELWMSAVTHRDSPRDERGIPEPVAHLKDAVSVVLSMAHDGKAVRVRILKDHDNPDVSQVTIALDPTTLLLMRG